ncbi:Bacteroides conjugative transposon TraK protein [Catalinimonas alkaloidigena]|uniref:Bacteroides conjugative transposon TraK protein n=1 Tax=Catalinimonas alkaloidigena TaxID=1075417 RepID=A0A1G9U347_9BACT|nr:conjugative transposon protein TraK [Catalinimonas alkaloidigena]SDM54419.1 Bacteroides conjugative transposon TraK protein [Catalinimonas alkaloidigena]
MKIRDIEKKMKLTLWTSLFSFITAVLLVVATLLFSYDLIQQERQQVYVLDHGVPLMVHLSNLESNRQVEYESHVNMFHLLFFTLPPDDDYIKYNIEKAMYLVDESGLQEYNNLREKGYYNAILSSSAVLSIRTDSIQVDLGRKQFTYYGTQRIERETSVLTRRLVTSGLLTDVPRTQNNPHGVLISGWKTVLNEDLKQVRKREF